MGVGPGVCRACHRDILWAVTVNGRSMPLDPAPDPAGNVAVWWNPDQVPCATVITASRPVNPGEVVHQPHFATCPARKRPAMKAATPSNTAQLARRVRFGDPQLELGVDLPANVIRFRPRRGES